MKCSIVLAAAACAQATEDTAPPTISLALNANGQWNAADNATDAKHYRDWTAATATKRGVIGATIPANTDLMSDHQHQKAYATECNVLTDTLTTCPPPQAAAFDHHDQHISIDVGITEFVTAEAKAVLAMTKDNLGSKVMTPTNVGSSTLSTGSSYDVEADPDGIFAHIVGTAGVVGSVNTGPSLGATYNKRAEYVLTYDATDRAGNQADQLIHSMIIRDLVAPTISLPSLPATIEARDWDQIPDANKDNCVYADADGGTCAGANHAEDPASFHTGDRGRFVVPPTYTYTDNYDGVVVAGEDSAKLFYQVKSPGSGTWSVEYDHATGIALEIGDILGDYKVKITAIDYASIFGVDHEHNQHSEEVTINVVDTQAPTVYPQPYTHTVHTDRPSRNDNVIVGAFCGAAIGAHATNAYDCDNSVEGTAEEAHTACVEQQWKRTVGKDHVDGDLCAGYTHDGTSYTLYNAGTTVSCTKLLTDSAIHECGTAYTEPRAIGVDIRGSYTTAGTDCEQFDSVDPTALTVVISGDLLEQTTAAQYGADGALLNADHHATGTDLYNYVGTYKTVYTTEDGGQVTSANRTVNVVDTTPPTIHITTLGIITVMKNANGYTGKQSTDEEAGAERATQDLNVAHTHNESGSDFLHGAAGSVGYLASNETRNASFVEATTDCQNNDESSKTWCKVFNHPSEFTSTAHIIYHSSGYAADEANIGRLTTPYMGFTCHDDCNGDITEDAVTNAGVTTTWHIDECTGTATTWDSLIPGTYVLKYACADASANTASKCRTVVNLDHTKPVLTVLEADEQTYESTRTDNYIDAGATCSDEVDKDISQDVEVSGDVVNLARVAQYTVLYNCMDSAGNKAEEATRRVWVEDTTCPTCQVKTLSGLSSIHETIEGSFPYTDAGAVASDSLQGSFGICSTWSENTITPYADIVNTEATGTYVITYRVKDSAGNWNANDVNGGCSGSQDDEKSNERTVVVIDTLKPVIGLYFKENGEAPDGTAGEHGLIQVGDSSDTSSTNGRHAGQANVAGDHYTNGAEYESNHWPGHVKATHADGTPVTLMAETAAASGTSGWVLGAVASGVSGLALLGYAMKRQTVVTVVPV